MKWIKWTTPTIFIVMLCVSLFVFIERAESSFDVVTADKVREIMVDTNGNVCYDIWLYENVQPVNTPHNTHFHQGKPTT